MNGKQQKNIDTAKRIVKLPISAIKFIKEKRNLENQIRNNLVKTQIYSKHITLPITFSKQGSTMIWPDGLVFQFTENMVEFCMTGTYEEPSRKLAFEQLPQNGVFMDVGTNIGLYTVKMSKKAGKIYSFEPIKETRKTLKKNLELNNITNVTLIPQALGEKKSTKYFVNNLRGKNHLAKRKTVHSEKVQINTLDNFVKTKKIKKIDFIKVDIEGNEPLFIKGGLATLKKFKPDLLLEIDKKHLMRYNYTPEQVMTQLEEIGYECIYCLSHTKVIKYQPKQLKGASRNYFFRHSKKSK